jgi:ribonuclease/clavin/mitogillin
MLIVHNSSHYKVLRSSVLPHVSNYLIKEGTNTYIVGTGPKRVLIDTGEGYPSWIKALEEVFRKENASPVKTIITHWHHDHVGGIRQVLDLFPETKIYKNQLYQPAEEQSDIEDGQTFRVEGASLRAVHSPG